jgi:prepilin-type N-terminal cleavage/methylation domain-containing protein
MKRSGFTLLELLIVIIIIGILALIAVPQFFQVTDKAKEAKAKDMLNSIARVAAQYRSVTGSWPANTASGGTINIDMDADGTNEITLTLTPDTYYSYSTDGNVGTASAQPGTGNHRSFTIDFSTGVITP